LLQQIDVGFGVVRRRIDAAMPEHQADLLQFDRNEAVAVVPYPLSIDLSWVLSRRAPCSRDRQRRGDS